VLDIKIDGLDELQNHLNEMIAGLDATTINHYCDLIKKDARISCGLKDKDIKLVAQRNQEGQISLDFQLEDRTKINCLKKVIRNIIPSLPIISRPFFEVILDKLDKVNKQ
jgi:hypothetical protein